MNYSSLTGRNVLVQGRRQPCPEARWQVGGLRPQREPGTKQRTSLNVQELPNTACQDPLLQQAGRQRLWHIPFSAPKHSTGIEETLPSLRDPFGDYLSICSQLKPGRPKHLLSFGLWLSSQVR